MEQITDPDDPRIADYRALTDVELRTRWEPPHGLFIAEGELVLRRALRAGYPPRSFLVDAKRVDQLGDLDRWSAPVYAATQQVLRGDRIPRPPRRARLLPPQAAAHRRRGARPRPAGR